MNIWKHFNDPRKNQRISVNINGGEVNVTISDGSAAYYAQKITQPDTYASKKMQQSISQYIESAEFLKEV